MRDSAETPRRAQPGLRLRRHSEDWPTEELLLQPGHFRPVPGRSSGRVPEPSDRKDRARPFAWQALQRRCCPARRVENVALPYHRPDCRQRTASTRRKGPRGKLPSHARAHPLLRYPPPSERLPVPPLTGGLWLAAHALLAERQPIDSIGRQQPPPIARLGFWHQRFHRRSAALLGQ